MRTSIKIGCLTIGLLLFTNLLQAEDRVERASMSHEIRIGWGDQLFETLVWHAPLAGYAVMPEEYQANYNENYRYYQHLWTEYQYRFNDWFGLGCLLDLSGAGWDVVTRNGQGAELSCSPKHNFYNIVFMPTTRFTYFHHPYVNLYSALGLGLCVNGGTEKDAEGRLTDVGAACNVTLLGLSANYKRYFAAVEYGGMYALKDANTVFLLKSRMFTFSMGVRF